MPSNLMLFPLRLVRLLAVVLALTAATQAWAEDAPATARLSASANTTAVQPGQQILVAVVLDVEEGLHAQSAAPLSEMLVPLRIAVEPSPQFVAYSPVYAAGHIENYPLIAPDTGGDMSVYTGRSIHYVPVQVSSDVEPGQALQLVGTLTYQACDDQVCFAPTTLAWSVEMPVVADAAAVAPANAGLFEQFDASVWSTLELPTQDAGGQAGSFLGWRFDLATAGPVLVLGLAFVAGIFFNLVPCVLPVLPIKIISFYETAKHSRGRCFALGAAFSLGIVLTFAALAMLIFALGWISWGEMFSSVWFAGSVTLVLLAAAAYQFGLFSIMLPSAVYSASEGRGEGLGGNVLFGVFTAVLSTPCTFGLFAALLVWATTQPTWLGVAAITTVGAGMSSPYLLLSAFPELARGFPRTGAWSEIIKQATGFLLLGVAAYFARPLLPDAMRGPAFWWVIYGCLTAAGLFLVIAAIRLGSRRGIVVTGILATLLGGATLPLAWQMANPPAGWQTFSDRTLAEAREAGRPVLVKFTADWCANCQAIEQRVFGTQEQVDAWIEESGLTLIKADLTRQSAAGWALLEELNPTRTIPFTAVYLPGDTLPQPLVGIYSTEDLLDLLSTGEEDRRVGTN